ncbi:MAG TPA: ABC transporter substrate binding protein, partial [Terriglobales bacterium]|nr:ABC transporter substrate binding protein [Terriglobales bacterium]
MRTYVGAKFRNRRIGAIIAIGPGAVSFSLKLRPSIAADAPIVFVKFDEFRAGESVPPNSTGIIAYKRFEDLVKVARTLTPKAGQFVLIGTELRSQPYRAQYLPEIRALSSSTNIADLTNLPFSETAQRVANLPDDAVLIALPTYEDVSGRIHNPIEAMRVLSAVANRPIVTDGEHLIAAGATAGVLVSTTDLGRDIAKLTARILNGEAASAIPVETRDYNAVAFNAQGLKRWNIVEESLPPGSKVLFREVTVWQRYRWHILIALAVLIVQSLVIAGLLIERHRRRAAERDSR